MKTNLATKFSALTAVILAVSFSTLGVFFIKRQKEILYHDLEELSVAMVTNLSANSAYGLVTHNKTQLETLLKSLASVRDILFSWIEDKNGEILAFYGNIPFELYQKVQKEVSKNLPIQSKGIIAKKDVKGNPPIFKKIVYQNGHPGVLVATSLVLAPDQQSKETLIFGQGVEDEKKIVLGRVVLSLSLKRVDENLSAAKRQSLMIVFIIGSISIVLTVALVHVITKPLKLLRHATEQVMTGIIPSFVKVKSKDEIGELAQAFNKMINQLMSGKKALEKAYKELELVNMSLEEKVAERTKELEDTILELIFARDELETAYNEMKNMYQAKAAFLRTASHELRTPLTAIKANIDYMADYLKDEMGEEAREIVEAVRKNCNHMRSMVEDMLTMVRIDSDAMPLKIEKLNLKELIFDAISELKGLQQQKRLNIDVPDDIFIECDNARFHDILFNLISNAYKFTPPDGEVGIYAEIKDNFLYLTVEDNGSGIPEKDLLHIFEPFYQAEHGKPGSGLGLAIVQAAVKRHGGTISCESEEGKGAKFVIKMPLVQNNRHKGE